MRTLRFTVYVMLRNITTFAVWLGLGFATQVFCYTDFAIGRLFDGSLAISVYAHILLWPLFLIWFLLTTILVWVLLLAVIGGAVVWFASWLSGRAGVQRWRRNRLEKRRGGVSRL